MATQLQIRRGNAVANGTFVGAAGEITAETTNSRLILHDGLTEGGFAQAKLTDTGFVLGTTTATGPVPFAGNGVVDVGGTITIAGLTLHQGTVSTTPSDITLANALSLSGTSLGLNFGTVAGEPVDGGVFASLASTVAANVVSLTVLGTQVATALGGLHFAGSWNAATNSPSLASGVGVSGALYKVSAAGTTTIDGISSWGVFDELVFSTISNTWVKFDGLSTEVQSVVGQTGAVTAAQISAAIGLSGVGQSTVAGTGLSLSGTSLELEFGNVGGLVADGGSLASVGAVANAASATGVANAASLGVVSGIANANSVAIGTLNSSLAAVGSVANAASLVAANKTQITAGVSPASYANLALSGTQFAVSGGGVSLNFGTTTGLPADGGVVAGISAAVTTLGATVANAALVTTNNTFARTQIAHVQSLTYGSTITLDASAGNDARVTLTGTGALIATPTNGTAGASGCLEIWQDSAGGRLVTFASGWRFGADGTPVLSAAAGALDEVFWRVNSAGNFSATCVNGKN